MARSSPAAAVTLVALTAAANVASGADTRPDSLQRYLSSMSWPVRASALRVRTVSDLIDAWITHDDPPHLGGIAAGCRNLLAVESRSRLLGISAPPRLRTSHARLVRAYSAARGGCAQARLTALATRAALERAFRTKTVADGKASDRAATTARTSLRRFERTTLRSFSETVTAWRAAVLRESGASGRPVPRWLDELP